MSVYKICLSLYGNTREIVETIRESPEADLFEIRVDLSGDLDGVRIREATNKPLIFTAHERPDLLRPFIGVADYFDAGSAVLDDPPKRIISHHGVNEDPEMIWRSLPEADIKKISLNTESYVSISRLLELNGNGNAICFAMGEIGQFSRFLSVFRGGAWIYASSGDRATAHGQFDLRALVDTYRLPRFTKTPAVFGIIGNPVAHSKSPLFHNRRFAEQNQNSIYLPFLCKDLDGLLRHAPEFGICGFTITHPFKERVLPFLHQVSPEVHESNACNTLFQINGKWHGINTDFAGVHSTLTHLNIEVARSRLLILGAGGAARAIAAVTGRTARELIILNRTVEKAGLLAQQFNARYGSLNDFTKYDYDVLFQTTSAGMQKQESPVPLGLLRPQKIVVDLIYEPRETALLEQARSIGCRTLNGELWFDSQAEAQYQWWQSMLLKQSETGH